MCVCLCVCVCVCVVKKQKNLQLYLNWKTESVRSLSFSFVPPVSSVEVGISLCSLWTGCCVYIFQAFLCCFVPRCFLVSLKCEIGFCACCPLPPFILHSSCIDPIAATEHTDGASEELKGEFQLKTNMKLSLSVKTQRFKLPLRLLSSSVMLMSGCLSVDVVVLHAKGPLCVHCCKKHRKCIF